MCYARRNYSYSDLCVDERNYRYSDLSVDEKLAVARVVWLQQDLETFLKQTFGRFFPNADYFIGLSLGQLNNAIRRYVKPRNFSYEAYYSIKGFVRIRNEVVHCNVRAALTKLPYAEGFYSAASRALGHNGDEDNFAGDDLRRDYTRRRGA